MSDPKPSDDTEELWGTKGIKILLGYLGVMAVLLVGLFLVYVWQSSYIDDSKIYDPEVKAKIEEHPNAYVITITEIERPVSEQTTKLYIVNGTGTTYAIVNLGDVLGYKQQYPGHAGSRDRSLGLIDGYTQEGEIIVGTKMIIIKESIPQNVTDWRFSMVFCHGCMNGLYLRFHQATWNPEPYPLPGPTVMANITGQDPNLTFVEQEVLSHDPVLPRNLKWVWEMSIGIKNEGETNLSGLDFELMTTLDLPSIYLEKNLSIPANSVRNFTFDITIDMPPDEETINTVTVIPRLLNNESEVLLQGEVEVGLLQRPSTTAPSFNLSWPLVLFAMTLTITYSFYCHDIRTERH